LIPLEFGIPQPLDLLGALPWQLYLSFTHNAGHIVFEKMTLAAKQLLPRANLTEMSIPTPATRNAARQ
jgi:hypothetical protein